MSPNTIDVTPNNRVDAFFESCVCDDPAYEDDPHPRRLPDIGPDESWDDYQARTKAEFDAIVADLFPDFDADDIALMFAGSEVYVADPLAAPATPYVYPHERAWQPEPEPVTGAGQTGKPKLWRAADLKPAAQLKFLAKNRIPFGAATILCGDEGIGKSLLWVLIVAAVTTGSALPEFGIPERDPADVVLILTEDAWQHDVLPRLTVAGAELSRVLVICTEDDGTGAPTFPDDMALITDSGIRPALVVVDAWLDTVPGRLSVKDPQQSREALHPWKEAAGKTGAAVLLLTHTNRLDTANMRDRYGASAALRQKARSTLFAMAEPDAPGVLLVGPDKANNSRGGIHASRFRIEPVQHFDPTLDHDGTVPLLVFVADTGQTIKAHLAEALSAERDSKRQRPGAEMFLRVFLADGRKPYGDVIAAGKVQGFSEKQLRTARERCARTQLAYLADGSAAWFWELSVNAQAGPEA